MTVELVKSKFHRARLTECALDYEGSLGIDLDLLELVGMLPYEKILVVNATNGERLVTYAIPAARGSKQFCLNGAAARRGAVGDVVTIMSFAMVSPEVAPGWKPKVAVFDADNNVIATRAIEE